MSQIDAGMQEAIRQRIRERIAERIRTRVGATMPQQAAPVQQETVPGMSPGQSMQFGSEYAAGGEALPAPAAPTRSVLGEGVAAAEAGIGQLVQMTGLAGPARDPFMPTYAGEDAGPIRNAAQWAGRTVGGAAPALAAGLVGGGAVPVAARVLGSGVPTAISGVAGAQGFAEGRERGLGVGPSAAIGALQGTLGMVPLAGAMGRLTTAPGVRGVVADAAFGAGANVAAGVGSELIARAGGAEEVPLDQTAIEAALAGGLFPVGGRAVQAGARAIGRPTRAPFEPPAQGSPDGQVPEVLRPDPAQPEGVPQGAGEPPAVPPVDGPRPPTDPQPVPQGAGGDARVEIATRGQYRPEGFPNEPDAIRAPGEPEPARIETSPPEIETLPYRELRAEADRLGVGEGPKGRAALIERVRAVKEKNIGPDAEVGTGGTQGIEPSRPRPELLDATARRTASQPTDDAGTIPAPRPADGEEVARTRPNVRYWTPGQQTVRLGRRLGLNEVDRFDDSGTRQPADAAPVVEARPGVEAMSSHSLRQPKTMQGTGDAEVDAAAITRAASDLVGIPIRVGKGLHKQRQAEGWYDRYRFLIRNRKALDLITTAHEVGHAVHDKVIGWQQPPRGPVRAELVKLGRELYGNRQPAGGYAREGIAEYMARRLGGEDMAASAPKVHAWFEQSVLPASGEFATKFAALENMYRQWDQQGAAARVDAHIERIDTTPVGRAKGAAEAIANLFSRRMWTNEAAPLEDAVGRLESELGTPLRPDQDPRMVRKAYTMTAPGTARRFIESGAVDTVGQRVGPSMVDAIRPVRKNLREFTRYAVARRAMNLHARGMDSGITPEDAAFTAKQYESPEFRKALDDLTAWNNHLIDYVVEAGALSDDAAKLIRDANPIYVPFLRAFEDGQIERGGSGTGRGVGNLGRAVKRIKGSGRRIKDPVEMMALQAERMIALGNKTMVARSIADLAERRGAAWFAEKLPEPKAAHSATIEQLQKQLTDAGVNLNGADMDAVVTVFSNAMGYGGKDNIVSFWRNGKREFYELHPDVYRTVMEMDKAALPAWLNTIGGIPKRAIQLGATGINISFAVANVLRDTATWNIYNKGRAVDPLVAIRGLWDELRKNPNAERWKNMGGELTTLMGQDRRRAQRQVSEALATTRYEKAVNVAKHPVDVLRNIIGAFESAPRIREFGQVLKQAEAKYGLGSRAAAIEALVASKDVTTDFTRAGTIGSALNQLIPFFNAGIQSTSKFWRTFSGGEGRGRALLVTARAFSMLTIPALLEWWMYRDEEWWQELPTWAKMSRWHFSLDGGKTIWALPKPFELGNVFASAPMAAIDAIYRKDPEIATTALFETMLGFTPVKSLSDLIPAALQPSIELATNYDFFRRRQIVPQHEAESKPPAEQFGPYTTRTARDLGRLLGVSPRKVEHALGGYTGGLGLDAARFLDMFRTRAEGQAVRERTASDLPIVSRFAARNPIGQGRTVEKFYRALEEAQRQAGRDGATSLEKERRRVLMAAAESVARFRDRERTGRLANVEARTRIQAIVERALSRDERMLARLRRRESEAVSRRQENPRTPS